MLTAPTPAGDEQRVAALHSLNLLDTLPEERFDRLTRLARRVFEVPIALVSLVDENRQWFKSRAGLDATETPRDISFCGHAIHGQQVFEISDASLDPRFFDNPLVTENPNIRFYAGCPLHSMDGNPLGTLCIIDSKPRQLNHEELETLQDLALMAERELAALQLATVDELTGISNRRGFGMLANKSLKYCARNDLKAALVYLDLNKFKPINDQHGHAEGDKALIVFADLMKQLFRESDVFARVGGDEFVVLLTDTDKLQAEHLIGRFQEALDQYNATAGNPYTIRFAHGVVDYNRFRHNSIDSLMADGDKMMYWQKEHTALGKLDGRGSRRLK
ncbi:MAG TPA: GGDEF domain-containing protein [Spongiibacteraceae bacterium]|nr:GGDEF domain-containing protein [Spongiibacteraceae bacterium]HCS29634.1 GGDEF domain-containing protein [Spongiibacteraceae bacterium]|tara:strand:+ start:317 stop:1315 length:999 start_codon:yes stop_codon:yes gene_type:complete